MNKKAIMVEFLVTIILALIIFTPSCLFVSKLFRISQQGTDSFVKLGEQINDLKEGITESNLLVLDDVTAIIGFNPHEKEMQVCMNLKPAVTGIGLPTAGEVCTSWPRPLTCDESKTCLCLVAEFEFALGGKQATYTDQQAKYKKIVCDELGTEERSFTLAQSSYRKEFLNIHDHDEKLCTKDFYSKNGIFILRADLIADEFQPSIHFENHYVSPDFTANTRRKLLHLQRHSDQINICTNAECRQNVEQLRLSAPEIREQCRKRFELP